MKDIKVTVVIPNYNGVNLLPAILRSLSIAMRERSNKIYEIIVVDDDSKDKSVNFIKVNYPNIRVIKHTKNRGFSSAVNMGVRSAGGNLVALLNTDVIPSKYFLSNALRHFEDKNLFAVSFNEQKYFWTVGEFKNGYITHSEGKSVNKTHPTFWVSGGSGLFRRKIWLKLGGLDERLFNPYYWEDVDISYRALKRGYRLLWEPKAIVTHDHQGTIGKIPLSKRQKIQERNHLLFIWKNLSSNSLLKRHLEALLLRCIKHPGYIFVITVALIKLPSVIRGRKREIKESKVSDESILMRFN